METERGCGWRQIGGVYLVSGGGSACCDALPLELRTCPCCDFTVKDSRQMQGVHMGYLAGLMRGHVCHEDFEGCPICKGVLAYGDLKGSLSKKDLKKLKKAGLEKFYLMSVSKEYYTADAFLAEAAEQGISKRISPNSLPKDFVIGRDWVLLSHGETPFYGKPNFKDCESCDVESADCEKCQANKLGKLKMEPVLKRAIFYAFKPERLEIIMWKGTDAQTIADYEQAGYTVVLIERTPENEARHGGGRVLPPLPHGFKRKKKKKGAES